MMRARPRCRRKGAGQVGVVCQPVSPGVRAARLSWLLPSAVCILVLALGLAGCGQRVGEAPAPPAAPAEAKSTAPWSITSPAFSRNAHIPFKYTCEGANVSPALSWPAPPAKTVEIALICNDPDAPDGNFVHWVLYGLAANRRSLPEGVPGSKTVSSLGGAKQGLNGFGKIGYGGPCPPQGPAHHYHFRLYALNARVGLPPGATAAKVTKAMEGHILAQADLVGLYAR